MLLFNAVYVLDVTDCVGVEILYKDSTVKR